MLLSHFPKQDDFSAVEIFYGCNVVVHEPREAVWSSSPCPVSANKGVRAWWSAKKWAKPIFEI